MAEKEKPEAQIIGAFGQAIRFYREKQGYSQETLADYSNLDRTYVSGIERGVRNPSLKSMVLLSEALDEHLSCILATAERYLR